MRGEDIQQHDLFSYGSLEERVPSSHPLRPIRAMVDEALKALGGRFEEIYDADGRKSIAPERLLRALLLQMLYSVRSERMLMEQLEYNLLFRWFVGLSANEPVWRPTVFTKNRDRLLEGAVAIAEQMAARHRRATWGADRAYDTRDFVKKMRALEITPHVAQNTSNRRSAVDGRTTRHEGYAISQRKRKRVEEVFGWLKTVALQRKTRFRGPDRVGWMFTFAAAAYNLVRMRNLMAQPT